MRVATRSIYETVRFNLDVITERLSKANKVVSSGKRITTLSDDPVGLAQALNIKSSLSNIEQLERNINVGKSWLAASENALTHVQNLISDAKAMSVQMANVTEGAAERASAAQAAQNMLEEIVSLANTQINGRYIFAGSKTDGAPFTLEDDNSVIYNGNNEPFTVKIGRTSTVAVGSDGESVFGSSGELDDIFNTFKELKAALENNDVSGIQGKINKLDDHFNHIATKISDIGSKMNRLEIKGKILQNLDITNTERLSKIEDADITDAIMKLKAMETAYQAALVSASRVLQLSVVDYL